MRKRFRTGGMTDQDIAMSNVDMAQNLVNSVQHHASEISELVKEDTKVPAWVVSLLDRAEVDLSDVAHYIDGELKKFGKGGETAEEVVRGNAFMTLSQIKAVKHHAEELDKLVKKNTPIEAWVLARLERAATYLSDVTHYLDGVSEEYEDKYEGYMKKGGKLPIVRTQFEEEEFDYAQGGELSDAEFVEEAANFLNYNEYAQVIKDENGDWLVSYLDEDDDYIDVKYDSQGIVNLALDRGFMPHDEDEEVDDDYAKGGAVAKEYTLYPMIPYGAKGFMSPDFKNTHRVKGTYDEAVERAKEMVNSDPNIIRVEIKRELKTKSVVEGIVNGQMKDYKFGGDVGRFYKASDGQTYRFIGDQTDSTGIFSLDGKYVTKDFSDFDYVEPRSRFMGIFEDGGEVEWKKAVTISVPTKSEAFKRKTMSETYYGNSARNFKVIKKENGWAVSFEYVPNDVLGDKFAKEDGGMMAKGGKVKRKRWIQDALSGDHKGALRETAKKKHLIKGDEKLSMSDLHKLEKMGGKTAQRAHLAETLRSFKSGGITPVDMLEARQFFGDAEWSKLSRKDKINSAKYLKRTGKIGYKKGGKLPEPPMESQEYYASMQYVGGGKFKK
jgi:ribosomal protein L39E